MCVCVCVHVLTSMATARVALASFSFTFFGATTRATLKGQRAKFKVHFGGMNTHKDTAVVKVSSHTRHVQVCSYRSYFSMATTHLQRPSAAVEAFLILAGSNSGLET